MNWNRTIAAFLLLIIISLPLIIISYLQVKQQVVRKQMLRKLEREQLVTIQLPYNKVTWIEPGKECMIGDEMFDVKEIQRKGDLIVLKGLFDYKEKELKRMLAKQRKPINETRSINHLYFFLSQFKANDIDNFSLHAPLAFVSRFSIEQPSFYSPPIFDLPYPPPDLNDLSS